MLYFFEDAMAIFICLLVICRKFNIPRKVKLFLILTYIYVYYKTLYCMGKITRLFIQSNPDTISTMYNNTFTFKHNFDKLPSHHTIFVANHPYDPIDYTAYKLIPKKIAIVAGGLHFLTKYLCHKDEYILYNNNKNKNFDVLKDAIAAKIDTTSVLVFVENYKLLTSSRTIAPLRTGIFSIAQQLGVTITPIVFDRVDNISGSITQQSFEIVVGDTNMVTDPKQDSRITRKFMLNHKRRLEKNKFV